MKLAMIGGGKMGEAMVAAWVGAGVVPAGAITVCDVASERREQLQARYGVAVTADGAAAAREAAVIVLAVKPQVMAEVAALLAPAMRDRLALSIAAGLRLARLQVLFPGARVVRVMPNLPATVAKGMSAFCSGAEATEDDRGVTERLLQAFGEVLALPEDRFDAFTALAGSGPAFVARFIEGLIAGGVRLGLTREQAALAARQTVAGTAALLLKGPLDEDGLVAAVSSPGGTTVAGRAVLEAGGMADLLARTLEAAAHRAGELAG